MADPGAVTPEFARKLPKIELHAHLSGSISRKCLHEIWQQKQIRGTSGFDLQDPLIAIPPGKVDYDIKTFFPLFSSYIYKLCSDLSSIEYSTKAVLDDFQDDGVVYLELRTTPRANPEHDISKDIYVKSILTIMKAYNEDPKNRMHTYLILSVDRRNSLAEAEEVVDLAIKYRPAGVVGVDLCGDPVHGGVSKFGPAFAKAKAAGLKITLHFAEAHASATDEELWTLLSWKPERLGHSST